MHKQPEYSSGFTLTELMISLAIAGMVAGIAIPSFTDTIASNRLTTYANELMTALNLARSEAIKRGVQVIVRRNGGNSTEWESGWDVFVDVNGDAIFNDNGDAILCEIAEDCLLRTYDALPTGYTLRTSGNTIYQNYAGYLPSGVSIVPFNDTFRLCYGTDTTTSRAIAVNAIGRARVSTTTTSCP